MNLLSPAYWENESYYILDQLELPEKTKFIKAGSVLDVFNAIKNMNLRGAPLIGAAASAGIALAIKEFEQVTLLNFDKAYTLLLSSRPTAVNLLNVLNETKTYFLSQYKSCTKQELVAKMIQLSISFHKRDIDRNIKIGTNGSNYIKKLLGNKKLNIITHCNAGALATAGYGTAIGVIRSLFEMNLVNKVWVDETRPYLQGSRLTAYELDQLGIEHTVITDNSASYLMSQNQVDLVVLGSDRMAMNGDFANKIGSYSLAISAKYHNIPYFTALPFETFDLNLKDGSGIVIEQRSEQELLMFNNKRIAPLETSAYHIGFDVVPAELVTGIITEFGVIDGEISSKTIKVFFDNCGIAT